MDPNTLPTKKAVGHYTQFVWAWTRKVGCGLTKYLQGNNYLQVRTDVQEAGWTSLIHCSLGTLYSTLRPRRLYPATAVVHTVCSQNVLESLIIKDGIVTTHVSMMFQLLVCNYGPGGNIMGQAIYGTEGETGSKCENGVENGLCL